MECLNGIIGKNNANNKKINSFENLDFVNISSSLFIHHLTYRRHKLEKLSKADHEMNTTSFYICYKLPRNLRKRR